MLVPLSYLAARISLVGTVNISGVGFVEENILDYTHLGMNALAKNHNACIDCYSLQVLLL